MFKKFIGRVFGLTDASAWSYIAGSGSASGKLVTDHTALQLSTVWACTRLTAGAVSTLPVRMYQKGEGGGRKAIDHPLNEIIGESPNSDLDSVEFWEAMVAWLCIRGNAFAEIVRSGDRVVALNILPADQVNVTRDPPDYQLRYKFTDRGKPVDLPAESVLHIRGFGFGGDLGLSPIMFGAQTLGSAIAAEEAAAKSLASGMMTSGLLVPPDNVDITPEQKQQLKDNLDKFRGSTNAGKTLMVPPGFKYEQLSLDPETMQLLETRRHSVEDCCRWFGVPPIMVSHAAQGQTMWGSSA